jgi:hypothetical protein
MNLPFGTGIGRMTVAVKSTLITDANTVLVVSFCVRTDSFNLTGGLYISIFADIKMITRPVETTPTMADFQIVFSEIPVRPCGGTVDHNQVNLPHHQPVLSLFSLFSFCERKTALPIQLLRFCQSLFLHFTGYYSRFFQPFRKVVHKLPEKHIVYA